MSTADMEKIARDCCHDIENRSDDCDMVMHAKVMKALARVSAPLVEALRRVRLVLWQDAAYPYDGKVIRDLDAALTGTGEKECPNCGRALDKCHGNCIFSKDGTQVSNMPSR